MIGRSAGFSRLGFSCISHPAEASAPPCRSEPQFLAEGLEKRVAVDGLRGGI